LDQAPEGMAIAPNTGKLRWQPTSSQLGDQTIAVRVTDSYGAYSIQEYNLRVNALNTAPNIVSTPITQAGKGRVYSYNVVASDAEGDAIRYSLITHPVGMTVDATTGRILWTPNAVGSFDVKVQATDSRGKFNTQTLPLLR
jgi:large repetitive protein